MSGKVKAIVLAGSRPGGDPLAKANNVPVKALIPILGKPMLHHVASPLNLHPEIDALEILTQDAESLCDDDDMKALGGDAVQYSESHETIAETIDNLLEQPRQKFPILVTTADNPLLDSAMIDQFLAEGETHDVAIAVVSQTRLLEKYPESRRTWLKFSDENYSGANLFLFSSSEAGKLVRYWAEVEQDRKKGWRMLSIFGPWLLLQALLRRLSINQMAERVGNRLGLKLKIVVMDQPEACIDVDKQTDLEQVEEIMKARQLSA